MINKIDLKAIGMGILINFGGYIAISLMLSGSVMLFEGFFNSMGIPLEVFTETMVSSKFIVFTLNFICCAIVFFGTYQCCRMARGNEWLNGLIALGLSVILLLIFAGDCSPQEIVIWNIVGATMGLCGIYFAVINNRKELADEKNG